MSRTSCVRLEDLVQMSASSKLRTDGALNAVTMYAAFTNILTGETTFYRVTIGLIIWEWRAIYNTPRINHGMRTTVPNGPMSRPTHTESTRTIK